VAPHLTGRDGGVSLRRLARGAKLSVASGAGSTAEAYIRHSVATGEVERRQRWLTGTAALAATAMSRLREEQMAEACGGSSLSSRLLRHAK
jgi:hypothetical protein